MGIAELTAVEIPELGHLIAMSGFLKATIARELAVDPALLSRWTRTPPVPVPLVHLDRLGELLACTWDRLGNTAIARSVVTPLVPYDPLPPPDYTPTSEAPGAVAAAAGCPAPLGPRERLHFGHDGTPMVPSQPTFCSCGKRVR